MKKAIALILALVMCLTLVVCGGADKVVRTDVVTTEDGSVYEHTYDTDGNHISEKSTLADGSYHEFQYDKNGNVINEIHK